MRFASCCISCCYCCLQAQLRLTVAQAQSLTASRQALLQRVVAVRQERSQLVMRLGAAALQQVSLCGIIG